jgi:hypothetical protein
MRLQQAFEFMRERIPHANPNVGFMHQLLAYEKTLFGVSSFDWDAYYGMSSSLVHDSMNELQDFSFLFHQFITLKRSDTLTTMRCGR